MIKKKVRLMKNPGKIVLLKREKFIERLKEVLML